MQLFRIRFVRALTALFLCSVWPAHAGPIQDLAPGKWYEIPNSHLSGVVPNPTPQGDPANIMNAWGGGTYDTDREQLIIWGGGHSDYAGNEVYAFGPMTSDNPTWKRLTDPSTPSTGESPTYPDGKPRSTHTYDLLVYDPTVKKMISFGLGSVWSTGSENLQIFGFDPGSNQWDPASSYPRTKAGVQGTSATFDAGTGLIWHRGPGDTLLESFDTSTGVQKTYNDNLGYVQIYYKTAVDPTRHIMIGVGGYQGGGPLGGQQVGVVVWDLANPGNTFIAHSSGDTALEDRSSIGLEFHAPSGTFIGWTGGGTVYRLTPPSDLRNGTWVWQALAQVSGSATPTAANQQGTYGRFRYIPSLDIFIAVNQVGGNVYVYKLGGTAAPPAPAVSLAASPTQVSLQGSSTLTWSSSNADACVATGGWSGAKATSGSETVGPLAATTVFTIACSKSGGTPTIKSATVTVATASPAPTVSLAANPSSVTSGSSSTLSWSSANATACAAGGAWSGAKATQGSQSVGPLTASGTFNLSCTGSGGTGQASTQIAVTSAPSAPTLNFSANPTSVASGASSALTWSSANATSCTASGAWSGTKAVSGTQSTGALTAGATFNLQCTGAGGNVSGSATVTVVAAAAPTVTVTANPTSVLKTEVSTLSWSSTNATSCSASGGWSGALATSGTSQTAALQATTTFTVTCTGAGGSQNASAEVVVTEPDPVPVPETDNSDSGGGSLDLLVLGFLAVVLLVGCSPLRKAAQARAVVLPAVVAMTLGAAGGEVNAADVTTLTISTSSSSPQTDVPVTFGQVFKPGDVPAGAVITASTGSGTAVPLQVDKKATHGDGSLRHAVLTARVPALAADGSQTVKLATGGTAPGGASVTLSNLLATSFDAEVRLNVGGTMYSASARNLLQSGTPVQWLNGPLVSEWIVGGSVKTSSGTPHPHLAAYFHVRAFAGQPINRARVDVVVENGWTMVPGPNSFTYNASVLVGGSTVYTRTVTHYHHARWHKRFWWGTDPAVYVKQDKTYLQSTGAVPRYADVTVTPTFLSQMRQDSTPMDNGDLQAFFPTTGGATPIGPLPLWTTIYATTTDERAFNAMRANDDSAASYAVHYRDELTGRPESIGDRPLLTTRFSQAEVGLNSTPDAPNDSPLTPDDAHQPSIAFVSYLTTGDYFYLEELQFWVSWNHLQANPLPPDGYRQGVKGIMAGQVRGMAWTMRNLGQAAYATPDDHPNKAVLVNSVRFNLEAKDAQYADNASANTLGALQSYDGFELFAPWMDDFYTFSMGYLVDLGFPATKMRNFKSKFPTGRMGTTDYCYKKAASYHLVVGTSNTNWWPNFATLYTQNFGANTSCAPGGTMDGYPDLPDGYVANLRPALAIAVDAGVSGAQAGWDRMLSSSPQINFTDYPNWAVIPRGSAVGGGGTTVIVSLSANPIAVQSGANTTLSWSTTNATSCTASGGWSGTKATSGSQSVGPLVAATTFTLACTGSGQTVTRSVDVTIATAPPPPPAPAPTVTLSANPATVTSGGNTTLTWSSTNATTCTASNAWSGTRTTSGSQSITNLTVNATFALSCSGTGGSASTSAIVMVTAITPVAAVTFSASPTTVTSGGDAMLTWSSTNATSCTASGGWSGTKAANGNETISNLTATTSFSLRCTGAGGASPTVNANVTVTAPAPPPPPPEPEPAPDSDSGGGSMGWPSLLFLLGLVPLSVRRARRRSAELAFGTIGGR